MRVLGRKAEGAEVNGACSVCRLWYRLCREKRGNDNFPSEETKVQNKDSRLCLTFELICLQDYLKTSLLKIDGRDWSSS